MVDVYELANVPVPREEAEAALRASACTIIDPDSADNGRAIIHSRASGLGADWNLDDAVAFLEAADEIVWSSSFLKHDLAVRAGERIVCFDVRRPERAHA